MILEIPDLLTPQEITHLRSVAAGSTFVDGRISNPHNKAKNNQQIDHASSGYAESTKILKDAILRNESFRNFTIPSRLAPPLLCKYNEAMSYGVHNDHAFLAMSNQLPLRSDLSITIFLTDPSTYDGGELVIHLESMPVPIKLAAGSAVIYPSTTLHEVAKVTRGQRLVAITFVESQFQDESQRYMLYLLGEVAALEGLTMKHENRVRLELVRANLQRMWC